MSFGKLEFDQWFLDARHLKLLHTEITLHEYELYIHWETTYNHATDAFTSLSYVVFCFRVHIQWSPSLNLKSNQAASDYPTCQWTFLDPSSTCSSSTLLIRINLGVPPNATALVRDSSGIIVVNNPVRRPYFLARVALGGTLRFSWFKFIKQELISMFTKWKEKNAALLQWFTEKNVWSTAHSHNEKNFHTIPIVQCCLTMRKALVYRRITSPIWDGPSLEGKLENEKSPLIPKTWVYMASLPVFNGVNNLWQKPSKDLQLQ